MNLDEIALKDRWLDRCQNPNWDSNDFKSVLFEYEHEAVNALMALKALNHPEAISNEHLTSFAELIPGFQKVVTDELASRQIQLPLSGFTVTAVHPAKIQGFYILDYLIPVILGAAMMWVFMYIATHFPGA